MQEEGFVFHYCFCSQITTEENTSPYRLTTKNDVLPLLFRFTNLSLIWSHKTTITDNPVSWFATKHDDFYNHKEIGQSPLIRIHVLHRHLLGIWCIWECQNCENCLTLLQGYLLIMTNWYYFRWKCNLPLKLCSSFIHSNQVVSALNISLAQESFFAHHDDIL